MSEFDVAVAKASQYMIKRGQICFVINKYRQPLNPIFLYCMEFMSCGSIRFATWLLTLDGPSEQLQCPFDHLPMCKGITLDGFLYYVASDITNPLETWIVKVSFNSGSFEKVSLPLGLEINMISQYLATYQVRVAFVVGLNEGELVLQVLSFSHHWSTMVVRNETASNLSHDRFQIRYTNALSGRELFSGFFYSFLAAASLGFRTTDLIDSFLANNVSFWIWIKETLIEISFY